MQIEVGIHATLRRHVPESSRGPQLMADVPQGATVRQLLEQLQVPSEEVHLLFVNGVIVTLDATLHDGDRLGVFPAVGGG
jgi:sulfur carrier protein ThiS